MFVVFSHDLSHDLPVLSFIFDLLSLPRNLITHRNFLLSLIYHHVSIFNLLSHIWYSHLTSKRLFWHLLNPEISHHGVVELVPLASPSVLYDGVIVSTVSVPYMNDKTFQNIVVVAVVKLFFLFYSFGTLLFS